MLRSKGYGTLTADRVFPQLEKALWRATEYFLLQDRAFWRATKYLLSSENCHSWPRLVMRWLDRASWRPSECFRILMEYYVARQSTCSSSIKHMTADRILPQLDRVLCRPTECLMLMNIGEETQITANYHKLLLAQQIRKPISNRGKFPKIRRCTTFCRKWYVSVRRWTTKKGNCTSMFVGEQHSAANRVSTFTDAHYFARKCTSTFIDTHHSTKDGAPTFAHTQQKQ